MYTAASAVRVAVCADACARGGRMPVARLCAVAAVCLCAREPAPARACATVRTELSSVYNLNTLNQKRGNEDRSYPHIRKYITATATVMLMIRIAAVLYIIACKSESGMLDHIPSTCLMLRETMYACHDCASYGPCMVPTGCTDHRHATLYRHVLLRRRCTSTTMCCATRDHELLDHTCHDHVHTRPCVPRPWGRGATMQTTVP